jgi:thiosulfate/3-mercaptopyruvate sulfurtransferase
MLPVLALLAVTAVEPTVSTAWLQAHLTDPKVRVICTGTRDDYDRAHIPGARFVDHMDTVGGDHTLLPPDALAKTLAKAGAADGTRIVLYGDRPMETGWLYMTLAAIGHSDDVSMLDGGIRLWQDEKRAISSTAPAAAAGPLTVKPAPTSSSTRRGSGSGSNRRPRKSSTCGRHRSGTADTCRARH